MTLKKNTDLDHRNKYITTQEFNKLTSEYFASRFAQTNLASKNDFVNFVRKREFGNKLKKLNKTKHVEVEKKITHLTNKVIEIPEKGYDFLWGKMYFTGINGYQNFLVFAPMLSPIIPDNHKKVTRISSRKIKIFDTNLEPVMSNLVNGRVIGKLNNSFSVQKHISSLYSNSVLKFIYSVFGHVILPIIVHYEIVYLVQSD